MLFPLGRIVSTPGVLGLFEEMENPSLTRGLLRRHASGDWGDLSDDDKEANTLALEEGTRLFSSYALRDGRKVWIITEADRSATTFLLPSEY